MMQRGVNGNQFQRNMNRKLFVNNKVAGMEPKNNVQKIRLRRNVTKQAVIEQNLQNLQMQSHKKRLAQAIYYNNQSGQSPLTRGAQNAIETDNKLPVHNRLGNKIRLRTNPTVNVNKNQPVNQRIRLQRVRPQGQVFLKTGVVGKRNDKIMRIYTAQNRLAKIRQVNNNLVARPGVQLQGNMGQRIRLRRNRVQNTTGPVNYTVQVKNSGIKSQNKHSITAQLDPKLQEEIRMIQCKNNNPDVIAPLPIHPQGTGVTSTSLNERFSKLI